MTGGDAAVLRSAAQAYATHAGWKVFPVWGIRADGKCECGEAHDTPKDMGKHPLGGHGHKDATTDLDVIEAFWPDPVLGVQSVHNVGIPCDSNNLLVIDVDPRNGGLESWARLDAAVGGMPGTLTALTGRWGSERGRHYYFTIPARLAHAVFQGKLADYPGIDFKHQGYVLAAPSAHGSGETYEWLVRGGPLAVAAVELPEEIVALILKGGRRKGSGAAGGAPGDAAGTFGVFDWGGRRIDVDALLAKGIHEGDRVNTLYPIMCSLANDFDLTKGHLEASFRHLIRGINMKHVFPPLPEGELDFQMQRAIDWVRDNPKHRNLETVLGGNVMDWVASQAVTAPAVVVSPEQVAAGLLARGGAVSTPVPSGVVASGYGSLPADVDKQDLSDLAPGAIGRFSHTDQGNAARLSRYYEGLIKYSTGAGWFRWDEAAGFWRPDPEGLGVTEAAQALPQLILRELSGLSPGDDAFKKTMEWVIASKSTAKLQAAVAQWKMDSQRVITAMDTWDANPLQLGVRNGVVDLKTGRLSPGRPEFHITKQTAVAYEPGTRNPRWDTFLEEATGGDKDLQKYLQLAAGYTLTGLRQYECLFLISGPPGTGKSTFLNVLGALLGKYHLTVPTEVLVETAGGMTKGNTEGVLADLHGRRMAEISEWPENRNTREDVIKQLTGESLTRGRHLYERAFEFTSTAKLWIGTNSRPRINDRAMWRRIRAIHFGHKPEKPDPDLKPFLLDPEGGLPAVLAWAVEGAVMILNSSVREPLDVKACAAVERETEEYRRHEDRLGLFMTEECVAAVGASVPGPGLFVMYEEWAADRGEQPMKRISFDRKLKEAGMRYEGEGRSAVLHDWMVKPRVATTPGGGADWAAAVAKVSRGL